MCAGPTSQGATFRTKCKATVRSLPSAVSMKIKDLPEGWKVVEAQSEGGAAGWIAVEPRGYVPASDVAPASPLPSPREVEPLTEPPRSARRSAPEAPVAEVVRAPRTARNSAPEAMRLQRAASAKEIVAPRSARRSAPDAPTRPLMKSPSYLSPRSGATCISPKKNRQMAAGSMRGPVVAPSPPGTQARASPGQAKSRPSPHATPSPQANGLKPRASPLGSRSPEVLALKEETLQLREGILGYAEQKLETRKELEELARAREAMAEQVRQLQLSKVELQEQRDAEQREFERESELQQDKMKEKLCAARDAVAFAVGSIDELYAQQGTPPPGANEICCLSPGEKVLSPGEKVHNAKAMAEEAGAGVCKLLQLWDEGEAKENTTAVKAKANKDGTIVAAKKMEDATGQAPRIERIPLSARNISF